MKTSARVVRVSGGLLVTVMLSLMLTGCATSKINWTSRIGSYSYDLAVQDFGPPDKQAKLEDGGLVAEWVLHHGHSYAIGAMGRYGGYPGRYSGPVYPAYIETPPNFYLRLTFGPEGKLKAWKKLFVEIPS